MAEVSPEIELTKVEKYQVTRSATGLSREDLLALSWKIATQPNLYRQSIPNPYSKSSLQTLSESFPDISRQDIIKATILAEPESEYDRKFKQLSHKKQVEALYQQINNSADITIRLAQYVELHPQYFWDKSEDIIYPLLTKIAFDTANSQKIEKNYSQNQRRGFKLSIMNFIEDLQKLKPYCQEFKTDAKATASRILGQEFQGKVEVESLPIGFIIYLDQADFEKFKSPKTVSGGVVSDTISSNLPQELQNKVIVINKSNFSQTVRSHELRHILFYNFVAENDHVEKLDTKNVVDQFNTLQDHRQYAEVLRKRLAENAKNEIIAYFGSFDTDYKNLHQLGGDLWFGHLEEIRNNLWLKDNLTPAEKTLIYKQYTDKFVEYLWQIKEYQWIASKLFASRTRADGLISNKSEALLQNTSVDKVRRLSRFIGMNPDEVPQKIQQEQEQQVREFSMDVDRLFKFGLFGRNNKSRQELESFEKKMYYITRLTHPKEALPSLIKFIKEFDHHIGLSQAIEGVEEILYMHQSTLSMEDFNNIKLGLKNMLQKRKGDDFRDARTKAESVIQTIDEVYKYGGVDFIHYPPLAIQVTNLMKHSEGQSPTINQISQLIDLLKEKDIFTWKEYFTVEYFDLLTKPEGIPTAIKLAETTSYCDLTVRALGVLFSMRDSLTPETKKQTLTVIKNIISRDYYIGSINKTADVRKVVSLIKDAIEKVQK